MQIEISHKFVPGLSVIVWPMIRKMMESTLLVKLNHWIT